MSLRNIKMAPNHAIFSILKDGKHGVIDGRWVCGQCGKSLSSPSGLDQHIQTVHGAYILPCDHCDLKFKRKDHVRKTKKRIYICPLWIELLRQKLVK